MAETGSVILAIDTLFKGTLRPRSGYHGGGDPLQRWKTNMINVAIRHQAEAKEGRQAERKSWHEQQSDGSFLATFRLNNCPVVIEDQNCWEMADLEDVIKFYDIVIANLKTDAFDRVIVQTALTIKSMRREAETIVKNRFPELALMETQDTSNPPTATAPTDPSTIN